MIKNSPELAWIVIDQRLHVNLQEIVQYQISYVDQVSTYHNGSLSGGGGRRLLYFCFRKNGLKHIIHHMFAVHHIFAVSQQKNRHVATYDTDCIAKVHERVVYISEHGQRGNGCE